MLSSINVSSKLFPEISLSNNSINIRMYFQFKSVELTPKKWWLTNVYMLPILIWVDHSQVHSVDSLACLYPSSLLLLLCLLSGCCHCCHRDSITFMVPDSLRGSQSYSRHISMTQFIKLVVSYDMKFIHYSVFCLEAILWQKLV